jgi:CspA family cold shock protein
MVRRLPHVVSVPPSASGERTLAQSSAVLSSAVLRLDSLAVERSPFVSAEVVAWLAEEGWGVLRSTDVPEDIWAHFSSVDTEGYKSLTPGERVDVEVEGPLRFDQDGYRYRAKRVIPLL